MFSSMAFMLGPTGASCLQEVISPRTPINRNSVGVRMAYGCVSSKVTRISTCSWRNVSGGSFATTGDDHPVAFSRTTGHGFPEAAGGAGVEDGLGHGCFRVG
jgi:hypothetical protein